AGLLDDVTKQNSTEDDFIAGIVESFGGAANMLNVENCATRLRVEVKDTKLVADKQFWLENREAIGVVVNG
ncbi:PTS transporter subunit EIIB, partial [Desulfovibrio desulfuricans]